MNEKLVEIAKKALVEHCISHVRLEEFAHLIIEECRNVVSDVYRKTPLEMCGPLLTADEAIAKHFYGENNE